MDTVTQALLGAVVGRSVLTHSGRSPVIIGAIIGIVPDLDVIAAPWISEVAAFVTHRSLTHSFITMTPLALLAAIGLRGRLGWSGREWLILLLACLYTHFLLDLCTSYGTQLLWPLSDHPFALSWVFIIDPAYSVPLLALSLYLLFRPGDPVPLLRHRSSIVLLGTTLYLGLGGVMHTLADHHFRHALQALGITPAQLQGYTVQNTPFNILQWQAIAVDVTGDRVAYWSALSPQIPVRWQQYQPSALERIATEWVSHHPEFIRLRKFSKNLYRITMTADGSVLYYIDLRFGVDGMRPFAYRMAQRGSDGAFQVLPSFPQDELVEPGAIQAVLREWWHRF